MSELLVYYFVYGVIFAFACAYVASTKSRSVGGWALAGFLLGLIGLLAIGFSAPAERRPDESSEFRRDGRVCPQCAEVVLSAARICRFCRYEFTEEDADEDVEDLGSWRVTFSKYSDIPVGEIVALGAGELELTVAVNGEEVGIDYQSLLAKVSGPGESVAVYAGSTLVLTLVGDSHADAESVIEEIAAGRSRAARAAKVG